MKIHFCFFVFFLPFSFLNAQTFFEYDDSGHRIKRNTTILLSMESSSDYVPAYPAHDEDESDPPAVFAPLYSDKLKESDVLIYPNPTPGALAVEIRNKSSKIPYTLAVYSLNGKAVFQQFNIPDYIKIDLSLQPKGVYLLRISLQDSFVTRKIIKE